MTSHISEIGVPLKVSTLRDVIGDADIDKADLEDLVEGLKTAKALKHWKHLDKHMDEVNDLANAFGIEVVRDPDLNDRYWGDVRGLYINVGDQYSSTLIYDVVDHELFVGDLESYLVYLDEQQTPIWEIPISIEDTLGYGHMDTFWVRASTAEIALEYLVEMEIEQGSPEVWGRDEDFDLGSVETTEGPGEDYAHQLWYITGIDPDVSEEELENGEGMFTKTIRVYPDQIKEVDLSRVRYENRFFEVDED